MDRSDRPSPFGMNPNGVFYQLRLLIAFVGGLSFYGLLGLGIASIFSAGAWAFVKENWLIIAGSGGGLVGLFVLTKFGDKLVDRSSATGRRIGGAFSLVPLVLIVGGAAS